MKAFSLKEYLKNPEKKVITRDGRGVRIRCTDRRGCDCPIVALVETPTGKAENILSYREDGKWSPVGGPLVNSNLDLFFAPEKHEGWINIFKSSNDIAFLGQSRIFASKEDAKKDGKDCECYVATVKIEWEE